MQNSANLFPALVNDERLPSVDMSGAKGELAWVKGSSIEDEHGGFKYARP